MDKKILAICTLKDALVNKYADDLEYLPLSNDDTDEQWQKIIEQYHPQAIVFGLQTIDEAKLAIWRNLMPTAKLKFVRKGTSLHRVDFAAAKKYEIDILNTAGVNSPFVAQFITDIVLKQPNLSRVGIIGVGDIGKKVAIKLLDAKYSLLLYNRSHHSLPDGPYAYCKNLDEVFSHTNIIAVCLPLNTETSNLITAKQIQLMPKNSLFICISPPRVVSAEGIIALDQREDIRVIFDHVDSGLIHIFESLQRTTLRKNFIFEEKAAAGYDCQFAMGEAAISEAIKR